MKGTIRNMTSVHRELMGIRAARNANFGVFGFTKAGKVYQQASVVCRTQEEAEAKAERMAELNPGRTYIVKAL